MTDLLDVLKSTRMTARGEGEGDDSEIEVVADPSGADVVCLD